MRARPAATSPEAPATGAAARRRPSQPLSCTSVHAASSVAIPGSKAYTVAPRRRATAIAARPSPAPTSMTISPGRVASHIHPAVSSRPCARSAAAAACETGPSRMISPATATSPTPSASRGGGGGARRRPLAPPSTPPSTPPATPPHRPARRKPNFPSRTVERTRRPGSESRRGSGGCRRTSPSCVRC